MATKYTPTQQRIMNILGDGERHPVWQLRDCLEDEQAGRTALPFHISTLRGYLNPKGLDIVCESRGKFLAYRLVRLLHDPNE